MRFWKRLRHQLFDNPISRPELEQLLRLFPVALAETETEEGFESMMRLMLHQETGLKTEYVWHSVLMHLESYRHPSEWGSGMPRTLARRFVDDPPLPASEQTGWEPPVDQDS